MRKKFKIDYKRAYDEVQIAYSSFRQASEAQSKELEQIRKLKVGYGDTSTALKAVLSVIEENVRLNQEMVCHIQEKRRLWHLVRVHSGDKLVVEPSRDVPDTRGGYTIAPERLF